MSELDFDAIRVRRNERGFIAGGTGAGKTFLAELTVQGFVDEYRKENALALIIDSKPRFRAQWLETGVSAARLYRKWDHGGKPLRNSYLVNIADPKASMRASYTLGARIFIATASRSAEYGLLLQAAERFFEDARSRQPRLVYIDEFMDFFSRNGSPLEKNDILLRCVRAGRELGVSVIASSQRTYQIPGQALSEATKFYVFRLDNMDDLKHMVNFGLPKNLLVPTKDKEFLYYDKPRRFGATVRLRVED